jgi:hypothetical protein
MSPLIRENIMKVKLITGTAAIDKAIASIKNRGAKLDNDIQLAGLSVLAHTAEHGDTGVMDRLVQAMPKSARKLALVEWMLAYGRARKLDPKVKEEAQAIKEGRVFKFDKERKLDLTGAVEKPWYQFKPEAAPSTAFDAQAAVASVLARLQKAAREGMSIEHKAEALAQAESLVVALRGE